MPTVGAGVSISPVHQLFAQLATGVMVLLRIKCAGVSIAFFGCGNGVPWLRGDCRGLNKVAGVATVSGDSFGVFASGTAVKSGAIVTSMDGERGRFGVKSRRDGVSLSLRQAKTGVSDVFPSPRAPSAWLLVSQSLNKNCRFGEEHRRGVFVGLLRGAAEVTDSNGVLHSSGVDGSDVSEQFSVSIMTGQDACRMRMDGGSMFHQTSSSW